MRNKTDAATDSKLTVAGALARVNSLHRPRGSARDTMPVTGGQPVVSKGSEVAAEQGSAEPDKVDNATRTGTSTELPTDVHRSIDEGDKLVRSELLGEVAAVRSSCLWRAATVSLTVSIGIAAIIIAVLLYLHSDLKAEQRESEARLMQRIEDMQARVERSVP